MKRMTTLKALDRRVTTLEGHVKEIKEVQASHGESLYELKRFRIRTDLRFGKLFKHFDIEDVSEEQVDEILDAE